MTVSYRTSMTDTWQYLTYLSTQTVGGRCLLPFILASPLLGPLMGLYHDGTFYRAAHGLRVGHLVWLVFWLAVGVTYIFVGLATWLNLYLGTLVAFNMTLTIDAEFCRLQTSTTVKYRWKQFLTIAEGPDFFYFIGWTQAFYVPIRAFNSSAEAYAFFDTALGYWRAAKGIAPPPGPDVSGDWPPAPRVGDSQEPGETRKH